MSVTSSPVRIARCDAAPELAKSLEQALHRALELGEVGVQVAAYVGEQLVVDAWAGHATRSRDRLVDGSTLFNIFSVTKALPATAVHLQAERGLVDIDAPVARYWPEFAQHGKDTILVRHVLQHRSGLPQMPRITTVERLADYERLCAEIAAQEPYFPPGTKSTYQALNFGYMLGQVVSRTDPKRRDIASFIREELCAPLGADDIWIGLPESEDYRVADLCGGMGPGRAPEATSLAKVAEGLALDPAVRDRRAVRGALQPSGGAIATARAVARFWAMLANAGTLDGVRLLSPGRVWSFAQPRPNPMEFDEVVGFVPDMGVAGYWLGRECPLGQALGGHPWIISHNGAGGSIGWADLDLRLAAAICHNRLFPSHPVTPTSDHPFGELGRVLRQIAADRQASGIQRRR
jgi:CubicO group peptidase (beta-lactamase class C family)